MDYELCQTNLKHFYIIGMIPGGMFFPLNSSNQCLLYILLPATFVRA